MKPLPRSLLIAIPISIVLTVVLLFVSAFVGGACHCMTLISVLFPYGTFVTMRTSWEGIGFYMHLCQFSVYAIVLTITRWRPLAIAILAIVHAIAAAGALTMYEWW